MARVESFALRSHFAVFLGALLGLGLRTGLDAGALALAGGQDALY
jgi:hypothetical protein